MATGLLDSTILIWNLSPQKWEAELFAPTLGPRELESLWTDLGGADCLKAHKALWSFVAARPSALHFLKDRLAPIPKVDPQRIKRWIDDLASDRFQTREAATRELRAAGEQAEKLLRNALTQSPDLELLRRLEALLDALQFPHGSEPLRRWRAIQVLESINTSEARGLLQALARGAPTARETREAQATLERLAQRSAIGP